MHGAVKPPNWRLPTHRERLTEHVSYTFASRAVFGHHRTPTLVFDVEIERQRVLHKDRLAALHCWLKLQAALAAWPEINGHREGLAGLHCSSRADSNSRAASNGSLHRRARTPMKERRAGCLRDREYCTQMKETHG